MSFPRYPEYKESGLERLGLVPAHWGLHSLKRSVEGCVNGIWGDEADGENDLAVIRVADFQRSKLRIGTKKLTYRSITDKEKETRKLRVGDLLIEKSGGGDKTLVGCVVLFEHDFGAVSSNFVARMRPLPDFNSNFLCYAFDSLYKGRVNYPSIKQTTGIQNLDSESYLQERFCFPSLTEQSQIARFLDHETAKIDTLIHEQKRLIDLLKEKRQAVISHTVTKGLDPDVSMKDSGVEWLGEVPAHWEVTRLKFVSTIIDCKNRTPEYFDHGDYLVVRTSNVRDQSLKTQGAYYTDEENYRIWTKRGVPPVGSLLFTREAPAGEVCIVPEDVPLCLGQRMMNFIPDDPRHTPFIFDFLTSDCLVRYMESVAHGSTVSHLRVEQVYDIPLVIPPIEEQEAIDRKVSVIKARFKDLIDESTKTIDLLIERRSALISAAVTGKIDVRDWQPTADESVFNEEMRKADLEVTA